MEKVCVAIISYKERIEGLEEASFKRCLEVFGGKRKIKLIFPKGASTEYYEKYSDLLEIEAVNKKWLSSKDSYNKMCCNKNFWKIFTDYEYVLIYQTDCWVFKDDLDKYINMGYDWYGAPWPFWGNDVGNGGFSLRKVQKMIDICEKHRLVKNNMNEDVWFCRKLKDEMNVCPWETAVNFSFEKESVELLSKIETIPMGLHGFFNSKFWDADGSLFMAHKEKVFGKNKNLDIFIGAYKDFKTPVSNKVYKVICGNNDTNITNGLDAYKCTSNDVLDDRFYSEIYMLSIISHKYELKDYIGFCHYRKYFIWLDDVPDVEEIFSDGYDAIVASPLKYNESVKKQYELCHNIEDLYIVGGILGDKFPDYVKSYRAFINGNIMFPYNMFIMKRDDFKEYINFIRVVLDEYVKIVGGDIERRIANNKDKYLKNFRPNNSFDYQYRIGGYLAERLTNVFIMKKFKKLKAYNVKITEDKY